MHKRSCLFEYAFKCFILITDTECAVVEVGEEDILDVSVSFDV